MTAVLPGAGAVATPRRIPPIVEDPSVAPHRHCTHCYEQIGRHYGTTPVMCAAQLFGSAECARAWAELPRPTFDVSAMKLLPPKWCGCGVLVNEVCDCAEFLAGLSAMPPIVMGVAQHGRRGGAR